MNSFLDRSNKELLWKTLYDAEQFKNLAQEDFPTIIKEFEATITQIHSLHANLDIVEKNKQLLKTFIEKLNQIKTNKTAIKKEDIQKLRQQEFTKSHQKKIEEFKQFDKKIPDTIDFSDKEDSPNNLELELKKIQNERSKEIVNLDILNEKINQLLENQLNIIKHFKINENKTS